MRTVMLRSLPYTTVPPALVPLLLLLDQRSWVWPEPDPSQGDPQHDFLFRSDSTEAVIATATCAADNEYTLFYEGREHSNNVRAEMSASALADQLEIYAPNSETANTVG
jgi:hypothetical protein